MRAALASLFAVLLSTGCSPSDPNPRPAPRDLAAWDLLSVRSANDARHLILAADTVAYELSTPLFSDYARKLRTIRIPEGEAVDYREGGPLAFPVGTVISKTFYYPEREDGLLQLTDGGMSDFDGRRLDLSSVRLIETRLLVHRPDGWEALPYVWDEAQDRATLQIQGDVQRLTGRTAAGGQQDFPYVVPTRNDCAGCHVTDESRGTLQPIGPAPRHLNRSTAHDPGGQLQAWASAGLLQGLPDRPDAIPSAAVWHDNDSSDREAQARAWLDINCGHCHRPGGPADNSGLFLHAAETSPVRLGRCKPPVAAGRGTGGNRFSIEPGAPEDSILLHRITSSEPDSMMPELGRSLVQTEAVRLIREWIRAMPGSCS